MPPAKLEINEKSIPSNVDHPDTFTLRLGAGSGKDCDFLWQTGFPTVSSQPIDQETLSSALGMTNTVFADVAELNAPATLDHVDLLMLPYGSAVPANAWKSIQGYVTHGGNLLILGGQPLRVPVSFADGAYREERAQDSYASTLGLRHTYEIPVPSDTKFVWKPGNLEAFLVSALHHGIAVNFTFYAFAPKAGIGFDQRTKLLASAHCVQGKLS